MIIFAYTLKQIIMADNYLGKKMEDLANRKKVVKARSSVKSLDTLLLRNRSCRGWDPAVKVTEEDLRKIVAVNTMIPSAKNQQVLRFKFLTGKEAADFCQFIKLGALLPELTLPPKGMEPSAFIIICSTIPENKWVDMDLGIAAQSMLLKAVEMGFTGICIGAFNKAEAQKLVPEGLEPVLAIALGKSAEKYQILHIAENENHNYFRENGIHYIPKVRIEDLILK